MGQTRAGGWVEVRKPSPAKSEAITSPPAIVEPVPPRRGKGAPKKTVAIINEATRRIESGEVTLAEGDLTEFSRSLWRWWEQVRRDRKPVKQRTIVNLVRPIWKMALAELAQNK